MSEEYRVHSTLASARIATDFGTFAVRDGIVTVDDNATAERLLDRYPHFYRVTTGTAPDSDSDSEPDDSTQTDTTERDEVDEADEDDTGADTEADANTERDEICGEEMTQGDICDRPVDSCPYHGG